MTEMSLRAPHNNVMSLTYNQVSIYGTKRRTRQTVESVMQPQPDSVDTFVKEAKEFLDAHAEHRPDGFPDAMFAQFRPIADPDAWRARCVAWQRLLYDH